MNHNARPKPLTLHFLTGKRLKISNYEVETLEMLFDAWEIRCLEFESSIGSMASKALRPPNLVYDTTTLPLFSSYHKLVNKLPSIAEIENRIRSLMIKHKETDKQWLTLSFMSEKEKNPQKTDSKASFTLVDDAGTF